MSTTQDYRNVTSNFARLTAAVLFALFVGTGHVISPQVEGAIDLPIQVKGQDAADASNLPSARVAGELVFAGCDLDI